MSSSPFVRDPDTEDFTHPACRPGPVGSGAQTSDPCRPGGDAVITNGENDYSESHREDTVKATVAALRTTPERVLEDYDRLFDLADARAHLAAGATTILKDNISWHFPFPAANTTPWQLEGTIQALARRGFTDQVCVQNKTVVTNAFKGEDLNHYVPIFKHYQVPVLYNFRDTDMKWIPYSPKARMHVLDRIFPEGI